MSAKFIIAAFICCSALCADAQHDPKVDAVLKEGKLLYRSEMASWYGSDIVVEKFLSIRNQSDGYFSYDNNNKTTCIYFSSGKKPKVLISISFDSTFNKSSAFIDTVQRELSIKEKELYALRNKALEIANKDTLFKVYENTSLNMIPLEEPNNKRVYFLTGPSVSGVVIFGNDYLLRFDQNNRLLKKKALHKNILPFYYKDDDVASIHSHTAETGAYITATDICTLLLYERFTSWQQHVVVSDNIVSIWDCATEELTVMPRADWDLIMKERKK